MWSKESCTLTLSPSGSGVNRGDESCRLRWDQSNPCEKLRVFQSFTTGMPFLQPLCGCRSLADLCNSHLDSEILVEQTWVWAKEGLCTLIGLYGVTHSLTRQRLNVWTENPLKFIQYKVAGKRGNTCPTLLDTLILVNSIPQRMWSRMGGNCCIHFSSYCSFCLVLILFHFSFEFQFFPFYCFFPLILLSHLFSFNLLN